MKKLILSAFVLAAMSMTTNVNAQEAAAATTTEIAATADQAAAQQAQAQQDAKTKIEINALPDAVKNTLASDTYKEWTASAAWQTANEAGEVLYVVEMKKGEETTTVKVDSNGKVVG